MYFIKANLCIKNGLPVQSSRSRKKATSNEFVSSLVNQRLGNQSPVCSFARPSQMKWKPAIRQVYVFYKGKFVYTDQVFVVKPFMLI